MAKKKCKDCEWIEKNIQKIIKFPDEKEKVRRTKDGYPKEITYDEFAYRRIVDSYRNGLKSLLEDLKKRKSD